MDLKQLEKLMAIMGRNGIKRVVVKEEGLEVELEREGVSGVQPTYYNMPYNMPPAAYTYAPSEEREEAKSESKSEGKSEGRFATSPMVGTYYAAATPEAPPFVKVGDQVGEDTVICIIEAMKVMNEIKAGVAGEVKEVLLKNGSPIEFGTKIIRVV